MKCNLCKEKDRMITTEYCIECFFIISTYIHEISIQNLKEKELI
jgi:hypothetical protein